MGKPIKEISEIASTLPLPKCDDLAEWERPPDPQRLQQWFKGLVRYYDTTENTSGLMEAAAATAKELLDGGFSSAEIRFAFKMIYTDKFNYWIFARNRPISPMLFVPWIYELRKLQAALVMPSRIETVRELCAKFPDEIHPDEFGVCSFDAWGNPLYLYKRAGQLKELWRNSRRKARPDATPIDHLLTEYKLKGHMREE